MKNNNRFSMVGKTETHFLRPLFFVCCFMIVVMPIANSYAASYALYVDDSADSGGDGSKDKPFKSIKDALEDVKSGENIYIASGKYDGGFTVPSSVGLYGESREGTVIDGSINAQNGVSFNSLTISGGYTGLTVKANSSVTVKKCVVKNATKIGINIAAGNGKLTVEDSKIISNGKGVYAQAGNQLRVSSSTIAKNKEEGLDVRNKVDGSITGNDISNNGESGVEIILGSSDMSIANNNINGNSASGIAAQFYDDFSKKGKVKINNNKIKNNNHFGIKCGTPSGGNTPNGYWEKSLNLDGNTFSGNDEGEITGRCKITLDDESAEKTKEVIAQTEKAEVSNGVKPDAEDAAEVKEEEEIAARLAREEAEKNIKTELQTIGQEVELIENESQQSVSAIDDMIRFKYLFSGPDEIIVSQAETNVINYEDKIARVSELAAQAPSDELKKELNDQIAGYQQRLANQKDILTEIKAQASFFNRLKKLYNREWLQFRGMFAGF